MKAILHVIEFLFGQIIIIQLHDFVHPQNMYMMHEGKVSISHTNKLTIKAEQSHDKTNASVSYNMPPPLIQYGK